MSKNIIEIVTLQIKEGVSEAEFLALSAAFVNSLKRETKGFIKYCLTKSKDHKWVELVWWESMEAAQEALKKVPDIIEFQQYCSILKEDELIYVEERVWM